MQSLVCLAAQVVKNRMVIGIHANGCRDVRLGLVAIAHQHRPPAERGSESESESESSSASMARKIYARQLDEGFRQRGAGSPWETARLQHTTPHVFDAVLKWA